LSRQHGGIRPTAYRRNARGLRDRQAFERVRLQAGALFAAGRSQAQVAHQLGVSRQNASRWHAQWRSGGQEALRSAGPTGHTPRLSDAQLEAVRQALRQGARVRGLDTDHWTLARIATVIEQVTGVAYIPGTCGSCWAGGYSVPHAVASSVTSGRSPAGWRASGRGSGNNARRRRAVLVFWDESARHESAM
jgi:transposase